MTDSADHLLDLFRKPAPLWKPDVGEEPLVGVIMAVTQEHNGYEAVTVLRVRYAQTAEMSVACQGKQLREWAAHVKPRTGWVVRLTYNGKKELSNGRSMNDWTIEYDPRPTADALALINEVTW